MPLRDILQKRDKLASSTTTPEQPPPTALQPPIPEIKFIRSDTTSQEIINPPTDDFNRGRPSVSPSASSETDSQSSPRKHRLSNVFRRSRSPSDSTTPQSLSNSPGGSGSTRPRGERRLSHLLHLDHGNEGRARSNSRNSSRTSLNVPSDLPLIRDDGGEDREAQWEKRATLLVQGNTNLNLGSGRSSCLDLNQEDGAGGYGSGNGRERSQSQSPGRVNAPEGDVCSPCQTIYLFGLMLTRWLG